MPQVCKLENSVDSSNLFDRDDSSKQFFPALRGFLHYINKTRLRMDLILLSTDLQQKSIEITAQRLNVPFVPMLKVPRIIERLESTIGFNRNDMPQLILIDPREETLITRFGVERILEDPKGKFFPWKPTFQQTIGTDFVNGAEKKVSLNFVGYAKNLKNTYYIAFFLADLRTYHIISKVQEWHKKFSPQCFLVVVGMDTWKYQFQKWMDSVAIEDKKQSAKWLTIPFADGPRRQGLMDSLKVKELPCLALLDAQLNIVHPNALNAVVHDTDGTRFPWTPEIYPASLPDLNPYQPAAPVVAEVTKEHLDMLKKAEDTEHPLEEIMSLDDVSGSNLAEKLKKVRQSGVLTLKHQFDLNAARKIYMNSPDALEDDVEEGDLGAGNPSADSPTARKSSLVIAPKASAHDLKKSSRGSITDLSNSKK